MRRDFLDRGSKKLLRAAGRIGAALTRLAADSVPPAATSDARPEPAPEPPSPEEVKSQRQESPPHADIRARKQGIPQPWPEPSSPPVRWSKEEELRKSWERPSVVSDVTALFFGDVRSELNLGEAGVAVEGVEPGTVPVIPGNVILESQGSDLPVPPSDSETAVAWWRATFLCDPPSAEVAAVVLETTRGGPWRGEAKVVTDVEVRKASARNETRLLPEVIRSLLDDPPKRPLAKLDDDVTEANVDVLNTIAASRSTLRQLLSDTTLAGTRAIAARLAPLLHPVLGAHVIHLDTELFLPWFQSERERCRLIPFFSTAALSFKNRPARLSVSHDVKERLAALGWFPYLMDARNQTVWVGFIPVAANAAPLSEALSLLPDDVAPRATSNWALYQHPVPFICLYGNEPIEFNRDDAG